VATDAWLYASSAIFAVFLGVVSVQRAQWHWAFLVVGPFVVAAALSAAGPRASAERISRWRLGVLAFTFLAVVAVPLALEIHWHAYQPEDGVIERAGAGVVQGNTPYRSYLDPSGHVVNQVKGLPAYESFFPYLPVMAVFGLASAAGRHLHGFSDARVAMTLFTVLIMMIALALLRAPPTRKIRVAQVLVVLPTGSLFLATGGDDMPILALCLLALVAFQRNRSLVTGVALGLACAMKLTAWPFALAIFAVSRTRSDARAWRQQVGVASAIVAVTVIPYVAMGPRGFIANVFAFPLGVAGVASPAASPLPGHILTSLVPQLRHVVLPVVFVVGGAFFVRACRRRWPLDLPTALRLLAVAMTVVICAANATRIGYLIYPVNFLLWSWVVTPAEDESAEGVVLVHANSPRRAVAA
jgi:hypothetical protein